jgi:hypothetical protein
LKDEVDAKALFEFAEITLKVGVSPVEIRVAPNSK